jgi:hypothetical protein
MALNCLVHLSISAGQGFAEVRVNSLHQLALIMPASVISYEVRRPAESVSSAHVEDAELFEVLLGIVRDIEHQSAGDD